MPDFPENQFPTSHQALRALAEHHIIISSENGTLYKIKQSSLPQVGKVVKNPQGTTKMALDILASISGGPIEADTGSEKQSYYSLNCKAFQPPRPTQYSFQHNSPTTSNPKLPDHDFLIIAAENPSKTGPVTDTTEDVAWLIEAAALDEFLWEAEIEQDEGAKFRNAARDYVLGTLEHGIGIGLYPAVQIGNSDVIFCYIINCRCFDI